jgi:hypothetical protein
VLANQYLRAQGLPGFTSGVKGEASNTYQQLLHIANKHIDAAAGKLNVDDLSFAIHSQIGEEENK